MVVSMLRVRQLNDHIKDNVSEEVQEQGPGVERAELSSDVLSDELIFPLTRPRSQFNSFILHSFYYAITNPFVTSKPSTSPLTLHRLQETVVVKESSRIVSLIYSNCEDFTLNNYVLWSLDKNLCLGFLQLLFEVCADV